MKRFLAFLIVLLIPVFLPAQSANQFGEYFLDKTMRVDYFHIGDAKEELITLDQVYEQGAWAGSQINLIDSFNNGRYYVKVFDQETRKLIFSKGFDCYFDEYKTTAPALDGEKKTFHESILMPFPKRKVTFSLESRNRENILKPIFSREIEPRDTYIIREPIETGVKIFEVVKNGHPHEKVDLGFIGEGYKAEEESKFLTDLKRYTKIFFGWEPYKTYNARFNVYGVFKPSTSGGCDEPRQGIFKNTVVNSSFNALGTDRYLLTEDNRSLRNLAAHVPYDAILIMVNIKRYGGGGLYNNYCCFTSDGEWNEHVMHHEFGHSFAGLADEYYAADVAYSDFYPKGVEPLEPNITALLDPLNLKWKEYITPGIEIPTPWEKEEFDSLYIEHNKVQKELSETNAKINKMPDGSKGDIEEIKKNMEKRSKELDQKMINLLLKSPFSGKVGAFEGAGFSAKGLFRPMLNCLMLKYTQEHKYFCKVCEQSIIRIIKHYSE